MGKASVDLQGAQTNGNRHAEDGADDCDDINDASPGAVNTFAEDRLEDRRDSGRQIAFVDEVREGQARQREDGPGMQREVVQREAHGLTRSLVAAGFYALGLSAGRIGEVVRRLCHCPEEKDRADPCREEHTEPGNGGVLRLLAILA